MIYPNENQYMEDSSCFNLIPVFTEMRVDFETPVSVFMKVKGNMLLESVEQGENVGRFSIIAVGKRIEIKVKNNSVMITELEKWNDNKTYAETVTETFTLDNPLEKIRDFIYEFNVAEYPGLPPFWGGFVGYLGYEAVGYFENISINRNELNGLIPDGIMIMPEIVLVYDTVKRSVYIIVMTSPGLNPEKSYLKALKCIEEISGKISGGVSFPSSTFLVSQKFSKGEVSTEFPGVKYCTSKMDFLEAVESCKKYIYEGEIIQVVLSQQFIMETNAPPFELYRTLRVMNPSPYLFFLDFGDFFLIGSSPEVMVRVQDGEILLKPIAGTRKRGRTIEEDHDLSKDLLGDVKERAEHLMLVDLGRNDVGRVSTAGSVRVTEFMKVEKYSHVMHMVSTVKGELDKDYDVFDVIQACFPAGTLTGAPKIRAMEIIGELEKEKRGPYGGMIFNLGLGKHMNLDSCITIRTIILQGNHAYIRVGAGIVADSIPESEYEETMNKAGALINTINETTVAIF